MDDLATASHTAWHQDLRAVARQSLQFFGYLPDEFPQSLSYRRTFGYFGFITPLAVGLVILSPWEWRTSFFLISSLAGVVLSLGFLAVTPIYDWLAASLPLFGSFRTPDRLLVWPLFSLSALTAAGASRLWGETALRTPDIKRIGIVVCVMLAATLLRYPFSLFLLCIFLPITLGPLLLYARCGGGEHWDARWLKRLAYAVLLVDLWMARSYVCPFFERNDALIWLSGSVGLDDGDLAPLATQAASDRLYLAAPFRPVMRSARLPQWRGLAFYEPVVTERHFQTDASLPAAGPEFRQSDFRFWNIPPVPHTRFFDLCSVRLLVSPEPIGDAAKHGWQPTVHTSRRYFVYRNQRCRDRAALFREYLVVSPAEAKAWLTEPSGELADEGVIRLEAAPSAAWIEASRAAATRDLAPGKVDWVRDEPEFLELKIKVECPCILAISDSWAPGWSCDVDGIRQNVMKANYLHRAVELMPGDHRVVFHYSPPGLYTGTALTLIGLVSLGLLVGLVRPSRSS